MIHSLGRRVGMLAGGFLVLGLLPGSALADSLITGKIYEMKSSRARPLFTMRKEEKKSGNKTHVLETYADKEGVEVLRIEADLDGDQVKTYHLTQNQLHDEGTVEVRNGRIYFEYRTRDGDVSRDDERLQGIFVLSTTLVPTMKAHWSEILSGKSVDIRYGVPERQESVGFKFFKDGEKQIGGRMAVAVKLKPSSFIIAALVDPVYFYFDKATGRLLESKGRVLPKIKDGGGFQDLDAESVYTDSE